MTLMNCSICQQPGCDGCKQTDMHTYTITHHDGRVYTETAESISDLLAMRRRAGSNVDEIISIVSNAKRFNLEQAVTELFEMHPAKYILEAVQTSLNELSTKQSTTINKRRFHNAAEDVQRAIGNLTIST